MEEKERSIHSCPCGEEQADAVRVKAYNRQKILLSIVELMVSLTLVMVILLSGLSSRLADIAETITAYPYAAFLLFIALVGIIELIVLSPLEFYQGFILEHRYNLSNQNFFRWLWEEMKGMLVGVVLFTPVLTLFYFFLRNLQELWWLPVAAILFLFGIILARLGPVLIFPLFYKFVPIDDKELEGRLRAAADSSGLCISGVFRFNLSKNTKKANAAFAGLGKAKRIIIGDTLLDNFTADEIESVFAHEVGHYKYGHIWKGVIIGFFVTFLGLFLTSSLYNKMLPLFGFSRVYQLAALPLLGTLMSMYCFMVMPLQNGISRHFEWQADRYALRTKGGATPFISSMERLAAMNLADKFPHPLVEFWFYSHPSLGRRIEAVKKFESEK